MESEKKPARDVLEDLKVTVTLTGHEALAVASALKEAGDRDCARYCEPALLRAARLLRPVGERVFASLLEAAAAHWSPSPALEVK